MFTGVFVGGAAAVGAVLGGFIGSLVYSHRYWSHDPPSVALHR
jgi:hypothetical protein